MAINKGPQKKTLPGRRQSRFFLPKIEILESRELLTAGAFLQGTVFIDSNQNNVLDTSESYLPGASVALYQGTTVNPTNLLATTTTNASGSYLFDDSNVPNSLATTGPNAGSITSGLNPGDVRPLVETSPFRLQKHGHADPFAA